MPGEAADPLLHPRVVAIDAGDASAVRRALLNGASAEARDGTGRSLLARAGWQALPEGVQLRVSSDDSVFISGAIHEVEGSLVIAVVAVIAAGMISRQSVFTRELESLQQRAQGQGVLQAGLAWSREVLAEQRRVDPLVRLDQGWARPIAGLPMHASEMAVERHMKKLAAKNLVAGEVPFFLGAGAYRHHVPASVDTIIQRGEFLTAYTPYQPEIAQGTLQMLFEFQTQVARLYGCAVANASLYDGSTACWEAVAMATRVTKRKRAVLSGALHPHYAQVVKTMAHFTGDTIADAMPAITAEPDLDGLIARIDEDTACVVVQYPDILGRIEDLSAIAAKAHEHGALLIVFHHTLSPKKATHPLTPGHWQYLMQAAGRIDN